MLLVTKQRFINKHLGDAACNQTEILDHKLDSLCELAQSFWCLENYSKIIYCKFHSKEYDFKFQLVP